MKLETLYKKSSTGALLQWTISVEGDDIGLGIIWVEHGQVGGKLQLDSDVVKVGKNVGKMNGTTPFEQACKEAEAKHLRQLKKGYIKTIEEARAGAVDEIVEGGVLPMLAHTFAKQGKKISYPAYIQHKYDGSRMIAVLKNGKCTLWSRTRKQINSLPHIVAEIEKHFLADVTLDGEAYSDKFSDNFEHIMHLVRQDKPDLECTDVEFHIYDVIEYATKKTGTFKERNQFLKNAFTIGSPELKYLRLAETFVVESEDQVAEYFTQFRNQGYEGAILRNMDGLYVNKRSCDLIKVKEMQDEEFEIIGIEEGRGKLQGHVGSFLCVTKTGGTFLAKMSGDTAKLKEYFENHSLWAGKFLTVQFQDYTTKNGVPRFPVGLRFREKGE